MKLLLMLLMVILLAGCDGDAQPVEVQAQSIPMIVEFERGALGTGEIVAVDQGALDIGKLHTVVINGEGLLVVCAAERLPDGRVKLIEQELAGDGCVNSDR